LDLTGTRVAVIGTGASAVQLVPAIADRVAALHVFQRTAAWVLPQRNRVRSRVEHRTLQTFP
jgi:cation diffusion facilitator CzcD-associated flavoprotein CzcO